jgi:hypothetical protein
MASQFERYTLENAAPAPHNASGSHGNISLQYAVGIVAALLLCASMSAAGADSTGRKLFKWVDEQGVTHYGDRIPPEYAAQERHVINQRGVEVERLDAQKTAEQVAAEEQKANAAEESRRRDVNLLSTYASVQEIERLRDQRLGLLSDQIKVTTQFLENLTGRLAKLRANSMQYKPYSDDPKAHPMPDQLAEDLARVGSDMRTQEENLRQKRSDEAKLTTQFASDISRFKELKVAH